MSTIPPRLTVQELRTCGLLQALANAFDQRHDANELLDLIGFPQEGRPVFANARSVESYWTDVCVEIEKGVMIGGLESLLHEAAKLRPGNPMLRNPPQGVPVLKAYHQLADEADLRHALAERMLSELLDQQGVKAVTPRDPVGKLSPATLSTREQFDSNLADQAKELRQRRRQLIIAGTTPAEVAIIDTKLHELKRRLRDGPRLVVGDCLSNRYALLEELGSGGFATVWKAFDEQCEQLVAVKVLHGQYSNNPERRDRFRRGAEAMHRLSHPHVTRVLEPCQEDGGYYYFTMEYIPGGTFFRAVLEKRLKRQQVVEAIFQVGEALAYAHERGLVHRDVTPDNILLDEKGGAKLTDFDLVRVPESTGGTRTGALGKFVYAAPESLESAQDVDHRCDVYSLGMTALFGFFGNRLPSRAFTGRRVFIKRLKKTSDEVKVILSKATISRRDKRYGSVSEFCDALRVAVAARAKKPAAPVAGAESPEANDVAEARPDVPQGSQELAPAPLTLGELRRQGILAALATAFPDAVAVDELLAYAGYRGRRPKFNTGEGAEAHWTKVCRLISSGASEGGLEALLACASGLLPFNPAFTSWAQQPGSTLTVQHLNRRLRSCVFVVSDTPAGEILESLRRLASQHGMSGPIGLGLSNDTGLSVFDLPMASVEQAQQLADALGAELRVDSQSARVSVASGDRRQVVLETLLRSGRLNTSDDEALWEARRALREALLRGESLVIREQTSSQRPEPNADAGLQDSCESVDSDTSGAMELPLEPENVVLEDGRQEVRENILRDGRMLAPSQTNDDEALRENRRKLREALLQGESVLVLDGGLLGQHASSPPDSSAAEVVTDDEELRETRRKLRNQYLRSGSLATSDKASPPGASA